MNNLLAGLKLRLPKLPRGIDVIMKVSMQVTHVREEIVGIGGQDQEGRSQSPKEEAQEDTDAAMQEEEDEEDAEDDAPAQPQTSKEMSKNNMHNTGSLKRKAPAPEDINQGQTVAGSAPKVPASSKPWKKQKRINGRFAANDAPLAKN